MIQQSRFRRPAVRRLASTGVATALAMSVVLSVVPARAAVGEERIHLVDRSGNPFGGAYPYQSYGSPYASQQVGGTAGLDVTDATVAQSSGIVLVSTVVDFGAGEAAGTGVVIDGADGIVVTNHHVVEGSTEVSVTVATTGETYEAEVIGTDATHDVAVLQLEEAPTLDQVTTDRATLAVADAVTAVGDAGGDGGSLTAAAGTVTDVHEPVTVTEDDGTRTTLRNLVEVDADIIPGDSGGALLDSDGDVVGMNVAASSGSTDITGYVIPVRRVLRIAASIVAGAESATIDLGYDPFLGVELSTSSGAGPTLAGVLEGGAAAAAGITAGDTVTAIDGASTPTAAALRKVIASHDAGDTVSVVWTDAAGGTSSAEVTLGRAPVA